MRTFFGVSIVLAVSAYAGVSFAYPTHKFWHIPAAGDPMNGANATTGRAGAGGFYYTGSGTDLGLKCSHCHINNANQQGKIGYKLTPSPAWGSNGGAEAYVPGTTYTITVELTGEHLHATNSMTGQQNVDENGMAVTIEDAAGAVKGVFEANVGGRSDACMSADPLTVAVTTAQTTVIYGDCHGVLSVNRAAADPARTKWSFKWTAPAAGTGDLTIFLAVVDGNDPDVSSLDDDVKEVSIPLVEM